MKCLNLGREIVRNITLNSKESFISSSFFLTYFEMFYESNSIRDLPFVLQLFFGYLSCCYDHQVPLSMLVVCFGSSPTETSVSA